MDADAEGIYEEGDITLFGKLLMHRTKSGNGGTYNWLERACGNISSLFLLITGVWFVFERIWNFKIID